MGQDGLQRRNWGCRLRVRVLGSIAISLDSGDGVALNSVSHRRLIARLAMARGAVVPADQLADALDLSVQALRTAVARLRKIVGDGVIVTAADGYALQVSGLDSDRFEALIAAARRSSGHGRLDVLQEALDLWTGRAFGEFDGEDWARPEAVRLGELLATAREDYAESLLLSGRAAEACASLSPHIAAFPLRDRARGLLMRSLAAQGRQTEALRAYQEYRSYLAEEIGTVPSSELREIEARIATGWHDDLATSTDEPADPPPRRLSGIPGSATSFIGRDAELERTRLAVEQHRLVTIFGVGGVGKTRLALEVGDRCSWASDGAWFVELGAVRENGQVAGAVAAAIGISLDNGRVPAEAVADWCASHRALLVLDNCEHILTGVALLVQACMNRSGDTVVLATSREPLMVAGEHVLALGPLAVPTGPDDDSDAVRLFVERAREELPDFDPSADRSAVVEICVRLDGIPLAIELAAARMRALSPRSVCDHLDERFRLLTGGRRTAVERHRTLRATVDWSYDLLAVDQQRVFNLLSVFVGPFGLDDAVAMCARDDLDRLAAVDLIASLVDRSLVVTRTTEPRYRLLETLRSYGAERLGAAAASDEARLHHAEWFRHKATTLVARSPGPDESTALEEVMAQIADYDAAAAWAFDHRRIDIAIDIAFFLFESLFLSQLRPLTAMASLVDWVARCQWLEPNLGCPEELSDAALVRARCVGAAWLTWISNQSERAGLLAEALIALEPSESWGHSIRAYQLIGQGRAEEAVSEARTALETAEGDPLRWASGQIAQGYALASTGANELARGIAVELREWALRIGSKIALSSSFLLMGRIERVIDPLEALRQFDAGLAATRGTLAHAAVHALQRERLELLMGLSFDEACATLRHVLGNARATADRGLLSSFLSFTVIALQRSGDCDNAARVTGQIDRSSLLPNEAAAYDVAVEGLREALPGRFSLLAGEGAVMDFGNFIDQAIAALPAGR